MTAPAPGFDVVVWRHFRLTLPAEWELLQFSRNPARGRCAFADRHDFRLEMNWRQVSGPPDFDRMMSDYAARLRTEGLTKLRRGRHDEWSGLAGAAEGRPVSRWGRYFPEESCLVELVLPWPAKEDGTLEHRILDGFGVSAAEDAGARRWRAFGLDARVPGGARLEDCRVRPALAVLEFAGPGRGDRLRFERRGLLEDWMRGSPERWLRGWSAPRLARAPRPEAFARGDHRGASAAGRARGSGWLLGRRYGRATAWICPRDGRLYSVWQTARTPPPPPLELPCAHEPV